MLQKIDIGYRVTDRRKFIKKEVQEDAIILQDEFISNKGNE